MISAGIARAVAFAIAVTAWSHRVPVALAANCPERPPCEGCGCKGGPGYRGPDGRCVGFRLLDKICGAAPHPRCTFENAAGAGANRDCALAKSAAKSAAKPAAKPREAAPPGE